MTPSDKKIRTQNWLLPLLVFLIFSIILSCILYNEFVDNQAHVRTLAELNAMTYAEHMTSELAQGIAVTDSLQGILISEDGHENAILSRSGGDAFSVILTGTTCQDSAGCTSHWGNTFTGIPPVFHKHTL